MADEIEVTPSFTEETSILKSVKKVLGLTPDDTSFDADIFMHINSAFFKLKQMAVFQTPFNIENETTTWDDALGENESKLSAVKTYVYLYVKYLFDPGTNGTLHNAIKSELTEMEHRFIYECDPVYDIPVNSTSE